MTFIDQSYFAFLFVTLTIILQSAGMAALIQWMKARFPNGIHRLSPFRSFTLVVRFSSLLVCLHMLEILLWASFYRWKCFTSFEASFYFSAADYATVGAGDLLLKPIWRTLGPVEAVTGVLMCGLSASFLFAIVTRLVEIEEPSLAEPTLAEPPAGASPYSSRGPCEQTEPRQQETVNMRDPVVAQTSGR